MTEPRELLCLNCGETWGEAPYEPERFRGVGCPYCGSEQWEKRGFRQRCDAPSCSLIHNHPGGHMPWPRETLPGSSQDYSPAVEHAVLFPVPWVKPVASDRAMSGELEAMAELRRKVEELTRRDIDGDEWPLVSSRGVSIYPTDILAALAPRGIAEGCTCLRVASCPHHGFETPEMVDLDI